MPTPSAANAAARAHQRANNLGGANPVSLVSYGILNTDDGSIGAYIDANGVLVAGDGSPLTAITVSLVRAASTANVVIATALEDGDTVDGVTLATDDRVLLKDQTDPAENGVYVVVASGAAARATDFDAFNDHPGAIISVSEGTANAGDKFICVSAAGGTIDVADLVFMSYGNGDVLGPDSATDNALVRFSGATGKITQNSGVIVDDSDNVSGVNDLDAGGDVTAVGVVEAASFLVTGGPTITAGSGAPGGTEPQGSIYVRLDGSSGSTRLYVNTDGSTTWTNVTTAA